MKKRLFLAFTCLVLISVLVLYVGGSAKAEKPYAGTTLNIPMEDVPDTESIEPLLADFEAQTGIKVVFEKVVYTVMHEKLIPQLMAGEENGSYDVLQVDNYWVGEFVMAGWLRPLDDGQRLHAGLRRAPGPGLHGDPLWRRGGSFLEDLGADGLAVVP